MSDALAAELDALFQLPPAAMVEARDALAARLRKAGDKQAAARIKALKRPTPSAWALNQLHFRGSDALAQALAAAEQVRAQHARDGVTAHALRAAHEAQRAATHALVEAVLGLCREAGLPDGVSQSRKTAATVRGLLAGLGDEAPGRMTHDLEPGGFEAIGALGEPGTQAPVPQPEPARPDARARMKLANELAAEEGRLREATAAVARLRGKQEAAQRELEQQTRRVTELEAELEAARRNADARASFLARTRAEHDQALEEQANAEAAVAARRAALAAP